MAEGGKPLAEASVKLSVEGAPQAQQALQQTAQSAKAAAGSMSEADAATTKMDGTVQKATKSVRDLAGGFTRIIGTATAVVGALYSIERAVKGVTDYIDFLTNSTQALEDIQRRTGGLVPGTDREAQQQLDAIRDRLQGVNAELAKSREESSGIVKFVDAIGVPVSGIDALVNGTGRLNKTIEEEKEGLEKRAGFLSGFIEARKKENEDLKRTLLIEKEELSVLNEQERAERRIAELEAAKVGASEEQRKRLADVQERIRAEIQAAKEADVIRAAIDREASKRRLEEAKQEALEKIALDRKRQRELEERSIEGQRRVFQAGRDLAANDLRSVAVSTTQASVLLDIIARNSEGSVWRS